MKTPIQEMIDDLARTPNGIKVSESMKSYFIEKEKQMIIDAVEDALNVVRLIRYRRDND